MSNPKSRTEIINEELESYVTQCATNLNQINISPLVLEGTALKKHIINAARFFTIYVKTVNEELQFLREELEKCSNQKIE